VVVMDGSAGALMLLAKQKRDEMVCGCPGIHAPPPPQVQHLWVLRREQRLYKTTICALFA
jgi:hypothetical protein